MLKQMEQNISIKPSIELHYLFTFNNLVSQTNHSNNSKLKEALTMNVKLKKLSFLILITLIFGFAAIGQNIGLVNIKHAPKLMAIMVFQ